MVTGSNELEEPAMMPYQAYQLYQIERPKSAAEIRIADERAGRTAAALGRTLRRLAPAVSRRRDRATDHGLTAQCGYGRLTGTVASRHPSARTGTFELRAFWE